MTEPPRSSSGSWQTPEAPDEQAPWWVAGQGGPWHAPAPSPAPSPASGGPGPGVRHAALVLLTVLVAVLVLVGSLLLLGKDPDPGAAVAATAGPEATTGAPAATPRRLKALPPAVAGSGGFALLAYDRKAGDARWDPCDPIHYVTRREDAPPGGDDVVRKAFAQLSTATGLVFVDDGATTEAPDEDRQPQSARYGADYAPVLVAWSDARESTVLKGNVDGAARADAVDPDGTGLRLVSGQVTLDAPAFRDYSSSFRLEIVLHELGHLVGLDHVQDKGDIMYFESDGLRPKTRYTAGALRGLRVAGQGACFP